MRITRRACLVIFVLSVLIAGFAGAQDRLKTYAGYDQYAKISEQVRGSIKPGTVRATWKEGGKAFEFPRDGKMFRFDIGRKKLTEIGSAPAEAEDAGRRRPGGPERGRQFTEVLSPDSKIKAFYRDRNLWLCEPDGKNEFAVTTDGGEKSRTKYGTASWVYGEELNQITAMWWSPDSARLAFYRFDESKVPDYFLQMDQTRLYSRADIEAYPKAGQPNPVADIFVYDLTTKKITAIDVRDGKPFENDVVGYYVYNVSWSQDSKELLFNRTNRRQNIMEFTAANPVTGKCRTVIREEWPTGWVDNAPEMQWFKDGKRFVWVSDRTGFKNYYLYDLSGTLLATLTRHPFEVAGIVRIDEKDKSLSYMARDGANDMMLQLHRVSLDGKKDVRLTDPAYNHTIDLSPDGKYYLDTCQTHDVPPFTRLVGAREKIVAELARSDTSKFNELGLKKAELFSFKAADGTTGLYGLLFFPSNFDPSKKYPLLVSVYAGPESNGARETFVMPSAITELGFLVASFDSRGAVGRGRRALDAIYLKLGVVEVDDQAAGVKSLRDRPYIDKERVGIFGTSYGGYASAMALLRYPDVFAAACAQSPVTTWLQYDSIYTERYMWIPEENKAGYEAGDAMNYVNNLKGRLMIYYGTADNNVHPTNAMLLIKALQDAGKSFEVQVGPDLGHSALGQKRMMEFFVENLVLR
ncbi:MAG: DPP IV N-terminal domain-containing protein [Candidatus Aminicenantes bacterium]|nr:DPP IV N-terminal domain-containing protein [Candidatus Aminicenantes bacterium]